MTSHQFRALVLMDRRRLTGEGLAARRGGRKSPRNPLKANDRRKTAPASVGSAVGSAATRCATLRLERREANHAAPASAPETDRFPPSADRSSAIERRVLSASEVARRGATCQHGGRPPTLIRP
jgi:hypothetical protein